MKLLATILKLRLLIEPCRYTSLWLANIQLELWGLIQVIIAGECLSVYANGLCWRGWEKVYYWLSWGNVWHSGMWKMFGTGNRIVFGTGEWGRIFQTWIMWENIEEWWMLEKVDGWVLVKVREILVVGNAECWVEICMIDIIPGSNSCT
jgi:hypothetical protein